MNDATRHMLTGLVRKSLGLPDRAPACCPDRDAGPSSPDASERRDGTDTCCRESGAAAVDEAAPAPREPNL